MSRDNNGNTGITLSVRVTVGGDAINGLDYTISPITPLGGNDYRVDIPGGLLSQTIVLTPLPDNLIEGDETFSVAVSAPVVSGNEYSIGSPNTGQVNISDDVASVTLSIDDAEASESGPGTGSFTITRNTGGKTSSTLNVFVRVSGDAINGLDYSISPITPVGGGEYRVVIPGEALSESVTLTPAFDQEIEGDEIFQVELQGPRDAGHDYLISLPSEGQIVIRDFVQGIFADSYETN